MDSEQEIGLREVIRHFLNEIGVPFVIRDGSTDYTAFDVWPDNAARFKILTVWKHRPNRIMVHGSNFEMGDRDTPFFIHLANPDSLELLEEVVK